MNNGQCLLSRDVCQDKARAREIRLSILSIIVHYWSHGGVVARDIRERL